VSINFLIISLRCLGRFVLSLNKQQQNMEELSATQLEMNRRQTEMQEVIDALRAENELLRKG
jgi:hypothetical protein